MLLMRPVELCAGPYVVQQRHGAGLVAGGDDVLQTARELLQHVAQRLGLGRGRVGRRRRQQALAHRLDHVRRHEAARLSAGHARLQLLHVFKALTYSRVKSNLFFLISIQWYSVLFQIFEKLKI